MRKNKLLSRKLAVFVIGTIFFYFEFITENTWLILASIYVGVQMAQDVASAYGNRTVGSRPDDRE